MNNFGGVLSLNKTVTPSVTAYMKMLILKTANHQHEHEKYIKPDQEFGDLNRLDRTQQWEARPHIEIDAKHADVQCDIKSQDEAADGNSQQPGFFASFFSFKYGRINVKAIISPNGKYSVCVNTA